MMKKKSLFLLLALLTVSAMAMAQAVSGVVVDASDGEPVIGANVIEKGTTNGTITDFDGNFVLVVQPGAVLQISYMGYKTQEVEATPNMRIQLSEDSELLDEVVVVGYGVVKKNDATGSVTAIKPDEMNKGLNTNATDMLSGKIAGVNVTSNSGKPGDGAAIRIRGGSSLSASNDPLIIIDGLAMDNNGIQGVSNPLSMVNPADIETFTVLKDASATAIYGSRASNGVIIITTKKGAQNQKPKFSYEGNVSMANLVNRMQTLSGNEIRDYAVNQLQHGSDKTQWLGLYNTDWQDQIYRAAISTDHNLSITGGAKNMPYRFSIGYTLLNGIVKTNGMQRVTASMNLNPSFLDKHLVFNLNAKGMYIYNRYAPDVVGAALNMDPTQPVKGGNATRYDGSPAVIKGAGGVMMTEQDIADNYFGGFYQRATRANYSDKNWPYTVNRNTTGNPVAALEQERHTANSGSFVGNLEADYKIHGFEDLRLHANFGADYSEGKSVSSISPYSFSNHYYGWEGWEKSRKYNLLFTAYAQYYKDWEDAGQHFDIMAAYEWQHFYRDGSRDGWGSYPANAVKSDGTPNPKAGQMKDDTRSQYKWVTENYLVSFFGRLNWTGWNQVMLTATFRADGSSRFHKDHRWGYFPSVALGWKIKESFAALRDNNALSELKLRLNYGITGQQEIGQGDYPYFATYYTAQKGAYYPVGGENYLYVDETGKPVYDGTGTQVKDADGLPLYYNYRPDAVNTELTWEKTTTYGAGIDFGVLNSRVTGAVDYYYRVTSDLINVVNVPAGANFRNKVVSNIGSLFNQGVEFSINAVAIDRKNFKWDLGYNLTWNMNKITKLNAADNDDSYYVPTGGISTGTGGTIQAHKVGYAASTFYVYETKKGTDANGNTMYYAVDRNKDGKVDGEDRYMHKCPMAPVTMGFQTKFQFYGFDLGLTFRASIGNYVYNGVLAGTVYNVSPENVYTNLNGGYFGLTRNAFNTYWGGMKSDGMMELVWDDTKGEYVDGKSFSDWFLTDYFVENASFLRCDNITLGYTFDQKVTKGKLNARIYATVQNPFVISSYSGLDPEIFGGIDNNIYPRSMTTVLGVSLQF